MSSYTVYALYFAEKPMEVATAKGFIGSTRQTITKCLRDHNKNIAKGTHTNKHLNATKGRMLELYVVASGLSLDECNTLLRTLRPSASIGWNITSASRSTAERHTGKIRPTQTKLRISEGMKGKHTGKTYSDEHRKAISDGSQNRYRPVDVFDYITEEKIASGVSLPYWCKLNGYSKGLMYLTVNADFSKPHHHLNNKYHYRMLYARWSE